MRLKSWKNSPAAALSKDEYERFRTTEALEEGRFSHQSSSEVDSRPSGLHEDASRTSARGSLEHLKCLSAHGRTAFSMIHRLVILSSLVALLLVRSQSKPREEHTSQAWSSQLSQSRNVPSRGASEVAPQVQLKPAQLSWQTEAVVKCMHSCGRDEILKWIPGLVQWILVILLAFSVE